MKKISLIFCICFLSISILLSANQALAANSAPIIGTITPSSGSSPVDTPITFTTTYSDPNGWQDIQYVHLMVNTAVNETKCFYGYYNQNINKLYLRDDNSTAWLGGFAPGSSNIIENSYAKLDCSKTTVTGSGNTLTVKWNITFKPTFAGTQVKNTYLFVKDDSQAYNGWLQKGTWLVGANTAPSVGTITPSSGSSQPNVAVTFTTTYSDLNGWQDISRARLMLHPSTPSMANSIYAYYDQNINYFYLWDETSAKWLSAPYGSVTTLVGKYGQLNVAASSILKSGNNLTVKFNIAPFANFASTQTKNLYLYVDDDSNANTGFVKQGTWLVGINTAPSVGTITPASGTSVVNTAVNFTTTYSDPNGWQNIQYVHLMVNTAVNETNCFYGYYNQNVNKLYLRNDSSAAWLGGYAPGSFNTIENSYVKLDCSKTTVSGSETTLTVKWNIEFKFIFGGIKNTYLFVKDDSGVYNGWIQKGTWTINVPNEADEFAVASGNRLVLRDSQKNFYFSSTNQYYLFYKPINMVDEVFNDAKAMGINVIRTWGFCDGSWKEGVSFQPEPGVYDETGFSRMDYLIKKAKESGIRLIITLVNNWNDFGGMSAYVGWSPTAPLPKTHDAFYTDTYCKNLYKDYVQYFLNRVNTLTGVSYKDDPAILIWELANEPRCESDATGNTLQAWIEEMSAFIKSIDNNHLVSTGEEGWYSVNGFSSYGTDYIRNSQSPNIDICSFHLFQNNMPEGSGWITQHTNDAHFLIGKPVYCGEIGVQVARAASNAAQQMATRNQIYTEWYGKFFDRVIEGAGFWLLSADSYPDYDSYTVYYPGDTATCSIITSFSNQMAQQRSINYLPPIILLEDKQVNEQIPLEFQIPISNPSNLNLSFSSPNLLVDATLDNYGYFRWSSPTAGIYKDIQIDVSYGSSVSPGKFSINVIDVNGDNTPYLSDIPEVTMDKGTTLDNAVDLWMYAIDDETPVQNLIFSVTPGDFRQGVSLDRNRYIDLNPVKIFVGHSAFTVTVTDQRGLSSSKQVFLNIRGDAVIRVPADFSTIKEAAYYATSGYSIVVAPGTYREGEINLRGDCSLVSEAGPSSTIIDATGKTSGVGGSGSNVLIKGFTIKNANGPGINGSQDVINNIIENNKGSGINISLYNRCTISNNIIRNNQSTYYGGGITWGISIIGSKIVNNVIINNIGIDGGGIYLSDGSANSVLSGNIIINNRTSSGYSGGIRAADTNNSIIYNDVWNNSPNNYYEYTPGADSISQDPKFTNPGIGDYHLQSSSPCINTGNPDSQYNDKDGSRNDMGIYGGPDSF